MLPLASLLSALRAAYPKARLQLLCRADLVARTQRFISVSLDDVIACDPHDESSLTLLAERVRALPCDLFIAADTASHAIASVVQAQRTIEAPSARDHQTDFQRYRLLLSALGVMEETPREPSQNAESHIQSLTTQLAQVHDICEERLQVIREQTSAIETFQAERNEREREISLLRAQTESAEAQLARLRDICEERDALIHEQAREIVTLRTIADERPRDAMLAQARIQSLEEQSAQLHDICKERDALIHEQAREIVTLRTIADERPRDAMLAQARIQSLEEQSAQLHDICKERDALIHEQAREIETLRAITDERLRDAMLGQARIESLEEQFAQLHRICAERDALVHEQAHEMAMLRTASDERLQALQKVQEESERRGVMLTDMTALAQEQEQELVRLRFSAK